MKYWVVSICVLWLSFDVIGQYRGRSKFKPLLYAGGVASQIDGDNFGGYHKLGAEVGVGALYQSQKPIGFAVKAGYVQKGSVKRPNHEAGDFTYYKIALHYLSTPLLLRYQEWRKNWFVEAGVEPQVLISGSEEDENGTLTNRPEFERISFDFLVGGGIKYKRFGFFAYWGKSILPARKLPLTNSVYDSTNNQTNKFIKAGLLLYLSNQ